MAEPTELEQIKQTQVLEKVAKSASDTTGKLDKVISSLKAEGTQEALLTEMKEQDELLLKTVKGLKKAEDELIDVTGKIHKQGKEQQEASEKTTEKLVDQGDEQQITTETLVEQGEVQQKTTEQQNEKVITLSDKTVATLGRGNDILEGFKIAQDETAENTSSYQDIMEGIENRKADLASTALADTKRSDKLAKREDGKVWGWMKEKGTAVKKMAGTFFENLMKLIGLLLVFFALTWLKGKNLKEMWKTFTDKIQEIIDEWIPKWIKDLTFGEAVTVAVTALVAAFAAWKLAVWGAKEVLRTSWNGIKRAFGWRGTISTQLDDVNRSIAKLAKEKNMMKKAMDLETDIGEKSKLATQIDEMDVKMQALVDEENAMKKAKKLKTHLDLNGDLSKQLDDVNGKLTKLELDKKNLMQKSKAMVGQLDVDSPLGKQLDEVLDSITELTKQRNALTAAVEVNKATVVDLKKQAAIDLELRKAQVPDVPQKVTGGRAGIVADKLDIKTKVLTQAEILKKPGALRTAEDILDLKKPTMVGRTKVPPVPVGAVDEIVKSPGWFKSLMNAVTDSKLWKGAKGLGKIGLKAADVIVTKILAPLEAYRGLKAGWKGTEGEDWDVRFKAAMSGMGANLADLAVTDTLRGAEAISGMFQDWYNDREMGTTVVDYNAKGVKEYFEKKLGAFKTGTTLEAMLESGEISWWDLTGFGKGGEKLYTDKLWELQMDTQKGAIKDLIEERKQQRINAAKRTGKESWDQGKHAGEDLSLFIADLDKSAAIKFLMEMTKKTDQDRQGRLSAASRPGNKVIASSKTTNNQQIMVNSTSRDGNSPFLRARSSILYP